MILDEVSELKNKYNKVPGLTVILIGDLTLVKFTFVIKKNLL